MPFKVTFSIFEPGKKAPSFTSSDRTLARITWNDRQRNLSGGLPTVQQQVQLIEPSTAAERYLFLVYEVRHLQRRYFDCGREKEVFRQALEKERKLDLRNVDIRTHLNPHPKFRIDDQASFAFFEAVEQWRKLWHEYFAYKKRKDADQQVVNERAKQCRAYEATIDKYIRQNIGLL